MTDGGRPQVALFHPEYVLRLSNADGSPAVTMHLDGSLQFHEGYDPEETARAFWASLAEYAPGWASEVAQAAEEPDMTPHAPLTHHLAENRSP